jgi:hypothetical protein
VSILPEYASRATRGRLSGTREGRRVDDIDDMLGPGAET